MCMFFIVYTHIENDIQVRYIYTWMGAVTTKKQTGWWLTYPSEKYEFVSWDDEIPNIWKK